MYPFLASYSTPNAADTQSGTLGEPDPGVWKHAHIPASLRADSASALVLSLQIKEARVVMDPRTKESRGFGFVDYAEAKVSFLGNSLGTSHVNFSCFISPLVHC